MTSDCATKIKRSKQNSVCEGVPDRSGCNTWLKMGEGAKSRRGRGGGKGSSSSKTGEAEVIENSLWEARVKRTECRN